MTAPIETDASPAIARYGVPARIGGRIVFDGRPGVITGYHRENAHMCRRTYPSRLPAAARKDASRG